MESEFLKHYSIKPKTEKLFELTDLNENSLGQLEIVSSNKKQSLIRCGNKIYEIYCESEWIQSFTLSKEYQFGKATLKLSMKTTNYYILLFKNMIGNR